MANRLIVGCPSCGARGALRTKNRTVINGQTVRNCYVYCRECDFRGPRVLYDDFSTEAGAENEAIKRWNRRL